MSHAQSSLSVVHIASGDRWAGAEVQVCTLLLGLRREQDLRLGAILLNEGEMATRLRAAGIAVTVIDESRAGFLQLLRGVIETLRAGGTRLIHTHRQKENILGALAGMWLGVPSLRTVHGAPEFGVSGLRALLRAVDRLLARRVQRRLIAVSEELASQLRERFPPERVVTIPNGIDIGEVEAAAAQPADLGPAPAGARHVGIAGRLDPVKRIDLFLEMAALLRAEGPEAWMFHVFGEGKLRESLQQQARSLGIEASVRFHGHRLDIDACLAALDVLLMCSDHEGLPMVPLEAIAAGTPVVAHAVGGLIEILGDRSGGVLVHEQKPQAYAEAVRALVRGDADALIARGRERIAHTYDAARNAATVASLYRSVRDEAAR